jgi:hypothetical protein
MNVVLQNLILSKGENLAIAPGRHRMAVMAAP